MRFSRCSIAVIAVFGVLAGTTLAGAQELRLGPGNGGGKVVDGVVPPLALEAPNGTEGFGPNGVYTAFHAARWLPWAETPTPTYYPGTGYVGPAAGSDKGNYWVQLDLPNGASVDQVYVVVYDADDSGSWLFDFHGYETSLSSFPQPSYTSFGTLLTGDVATPGYLTLSIDLDPPVVIYEWTDMNGDDFEGLVSYNLSLEALGFGDPADMRFWGGAVHWSRTVSPAPATATFGDVPTGHWAFQYVEALVDSGITAGCGGGDYCPDDPVTRAQMAVYLAAALGLYWST